MKSTIIALGSVACLILLGSCQAPVGTIIEPYLIPRAEYALDVRSGDEVPRVEADFAVHSSQPWQKIPVLPRDVSLLDWHAPGADLVAEQDRFVLWAKTPGTYQVKLRFLVPRQSPSPGIEEVVVPVLLANHSVLTAVLPPGTGEFTPSPKGIITEDRTVGRERHIRMLMPAADKLTLRWQKEAAPALVGTSLLARCDESLQVKRGLITRSTAVRCEVRKAPVDRLVLQMPPAVVARQVTGPDVLRWNLEDGGRAVAVALARKVKDVTSLRIASEEVIQSAPAELAILPVVVAGADIQQGSIQIESADDLVVNEISTTGATRSREAAPTGKAALSYLYARAPASVNVRVLERDPRIAVDTETLAVIEAGVLTLETRLHYDVQLRAVRSVAVALPEGSTILDISGKDVLDWEAADGGQVAVRFGHAVLGKTDVVVRLQQNLVRVNGIVIPRVAPSGVEREEGVVGVSAGGGVQLRHHGATLTDQIEVAALPEWIRAAGARLAYRYRQPGGTLSVSTEKIVPRLIARTFEVIELEQDVVLQTFYFDGQVDEAELFEVVFEMPAGLTPLRVRGETVADWELRPAPEARKVLLVVTLKKGHLGRLPLVVEASRTVTYDEPLDLASVDVPGARRIEGGLIVVPRADISQKVVSSTGIEPRPARTVQAGAPDFAVREALPSDSLAFKYLGPWSLVVKVDRRRAQVATTAVTLLRLRHGQISAETVLQCDIQEAGISVIRVQLPPGAVNSWVDGDDISSRRLEEDVWRVVLGQRRRGTYRLRVTYDRLVTSDDREVLHVEPQVVGALSHKGFLVVGKEPRSPIDVAVSSDGHLRSTTLASLPPWRPKVDLPVVEVFEYSGQAERDWKLGLLVRLLGEAAVLQVQASDCLLQTMISRDGSAVTFMTLTVENVRQQFARIGPLRGRVLWGAYVDGKPVKPIEADEPETYLVPLLGEVRNAGPFELSVVYTEQYPALAGRSAPLSFQTPPVEVPTGSMSWSVYLPPEYRLAPEIGRRIGNMQLIFEPPEAQVPVSEEWFSQDLSRFRFLWPLARPYVGIGLTVVVWAVGFALAILLVYLLVKLLARLMRGAARATGGAVRAVWRRPVLRWAAVLALVGGVVMVLLAVAAVLFVPSLSRTLDLTPMAAMESSRRTAAMADLRSLGTALEQYRQTFGAYPDSLDGLERFGGGRGGETAFWAYGWRGDEKSDLGKDFDYFAAGKKTADIPKDAVLAYSYDEDTGGYNVLRGDQRVEWVPEDKKLDLARDLYNQGDVQARIVLEDVKENVKLSQNEQERIVAQYDMSKQLQSKSRANLDELVEKDVRGRLSRRFEERYGQGGRQQREAEVAQQPALDLAPGAAEPPESGLSAEDLRDREKKKETVLGEQVLTYLKQAQKAAGAALTVPEAEGEAKPAETGRVRAGADQPDAYRYPVEAPPTEAMPPTEEPLIPPTPDAPPSQTPRPPPTPAGPEGRLEPSPAKPQKEPRPERPQPAEKPPTPWGDWSIDKSASMSFAPVVEGRSKGTLPIGLHAPDTERSPYLFMRAFSGKDVGQFEVTAVRAGTGYSVYGIAGAALLGLIITAGRLLAGWIARRREAEETESA